MTEKNKEKKIDLKEKKQEKGGVRGENKG